MLMNILNNYLINMSILNKIHNQVLAIIFKVNNIICNNNKNSYNKINSNNNSNNNLNNNNKQDTKCNNNQFLIIINKLYIQLIILIWYKWKKKICERLKYLIFK